MDILVTYDIDQTERLAGARRLRKVAKICEKYGERVQFSVFECRLSPTKLVRMVGEIENVIDCSTDSVIIYEFSGRIDEARQRFGRAARHELGKPWVL